MKKFLLFIPFFALLLAARMAPQGTLLKAGDKAPEFTITDQHGKALSLSQFKGKVVMVDFWASWCVPCREANPEFIKIYQKFSANGFDIISVSLDNNKDQWLKALQQDKLPWNNHGSELKGWDSKIAALYGVEGIPATFLIDESGYLIDLYLDEYDLEEKLNFYYNQKINVYPRSATGKIYFSAEAKFQIEDKTGKILLKGKATEADLTGMPFGEYVVRIDGFPNHINRINVPANDISFYPLRVDDQITLSAESDYEIYNARGALVKKGKGSSINALSLKPGSYHLSINGQVSTFYKK